MRRFEYTLEEHMDIVRALGSKRTPKPSHTEIWMSPYVESIKARLKKHKRMEQNEQCCYCQRSTQGEFKMMIDIEHILPKHIFTHCIFDLPNIAASCKRCNMMIKGTRVDFLRRDLSKIPKIDKSILFREEHYKFIHPNLVRADQHMYLEIFQTKSTKIIRYKIITELGKYTYEYFKLEELEIESITLSQGEAPIRNEALYEAIKDIERAIYDQHI